MKWIQAATLLILVVLLGCVWLFFQKLDKMDQRLKKTLSSTEVDEHIDGLRERIAVLRSDTNNTISGIYDQISAIETGSGKQLRGPKTPGFLLTDLERWIHLKKDAAMEPDNEKVAKDKIEETINALLKLHSEGEEVLSLIFDRTKLNSGPNVRAALIRDVLWRFGPEAVDGLMELFIDREFSSNLRNLAAGSALKSGGREDELLDTFARHLEDPEEFMTIKTGLVQNVFMDHLHERVVKLLIEGARNPQYPQPHRIACLKALGSYDHPEVIKALEEIIYIGEDQVWVVNCAIQSYHKLMGEKSLPFLEKLLEEGRVDNTNRAKIKNILGEY